MAEVSRIIAVARGASLTDEAGVELVHDVRVALRRCRSLAQGLAAVDGVARDQWRGLSRAGRPLFAALGTLRDAQVMREWVIELVDGEARGAAVTALDARIAEHLVGATAAINAFEDDAWAALSQTAPARAASMLRRRPVLQWLAIVRFNEARALHVEAMRRRSPEALHQVRIGVKRLRYTLESLLPEAHAGVQKPLKRLQDALGDIHDLDVALGALSGSDGALLPTPARPEELLRLRARRAALLGEYKAMATGRVSVWTALRAVLPRMPDAVARCRRAAVVEEALAIGADERWCRRAEAIGRAVAASLGVKLNEAQRLALVLAAGERRRRRAAGALLGVTPDLRRAIRRCLRRDPIVAAARAALSANVKAADPTPSSGHVM